MKKIKEGEAMKTLLLALALAIPSLAAAPTTPDETTYGVTAQFDDVWGPSCIDRIVDALGKVEGIKDVKVGKNKFFYDVRVLETKPLLPARLRKVAKLLEEYPFMGMEVVELAGTAAKSGDDYTFTARASKQEYKVKATEDFKKLVASGKTSLTLSGRLVQKEDKDPVTLEVAESKETAK